MRISPNQTDLQQYVDGYNYVPISARMLSDWITPIQVLRILKEHYQHCFLLESAEQQQRYGRYSFIGYDPVLEISARDGTVLINQVSAGGRTPVGLDDSKGLDETISEIMERFRSPKIPGMPPFTGGLVGYFGYDYLKYREPSLKLKGSDDEQFNDVDLMLFDRVIVFDNYRQQLSFIANVELADLDASYQTAREAIEQVALLLNSAVVQTDVEGQITSDFQMLFNEEEYREIVLRAKHYIHEGDIFQVVLSNRISADFTGSLLGAYRRLRSVNPSPYMFYFSSNDMEVAGASPETLVKVTERTVRTFPLAGTRPRVSDETENARLETELLGDDKELAEHNMLVDLGRNDLGKICEFGSVQVENYLKLQRFSHVVHIGSEVSGQMRPDVTALDAIAAVLPAGTLSGAPKLRAMEIIDELEGNKRGIYGGAFGYLGFNSDMDTAIGIRLAYRRGGKVYVRSGAGIVLDSDPSKEYRECVNKARAVIEAILTDQED